MFWFEKKLFMEYYFIVILFISLNEHTPNPLLYCFINLF